MAMHFRAHTVKLDSAVYPCEYSISPVNHFAFAFIRFDKASEPERLTITPDNPYYDSVCKAAAEAKQPRPAAEKPWLNTTIVGNGWRIEFDANVFERTRIIFDRPPHDDVKALVKAAGFCWAPSTGSWNRGLTCKAHRAAEKLAADLAAMGSRAIRRR